MLLADVPVHAQQSAASAQIQTGTTYYQRQQYTQAATAWKQAAQQFANQGDDLNQSMALTYLSLALQHRQQWPAAEAAITRSLKLLQGIDPEQQSSQWLHLYAQAYNAYGRLQLTLGRPELALTHWQQANQFYQALSDQEGVTGSLLNQALAQEAAGLYRPACNTLMRAMGSKDFCDVDDDSTLDKVQQQFLAYPDPKIKVMGLRNLSNVWRQMGDLTKSQALLQTSLKLVLPLQTPDLESAIYLSLAETERALYKKTQQQSWQESDHTLQSLVNNTFTHYQQATLAAQRATQAEPKPATQLLALQGQLQTLSLLLDLQMKGDLPQMSSSLQPQPLAKQLSQGPLADMPPSRTVVYAQLNLAKSLFRLGQVEPSQGWTEQSIRWATTARQMAANLEDSRATSQALGLLGTFYQQQSAYSQAQIETEAALSIAQSIQADDLAYQWQWQLGQILDAQQQSQSAIQYYQAALHTLQGLRQDLLFLAPDAQFSFQSRVEPLYRQLVSLLLPTQPQARQLQQARTVIDALQTAEVENYLLQSCTKAQLTEIDQLVDRIDVNTAFIYTIILDDRLAVILKLPNSDELKFHTIPVTRDTIDRTLADLSSALQYKLPSRLNQIQMASKPVYDWLIAPVDSVLTQNQIKNLVFVLDGPLRNIPIAALFDGEQFLIEKYAVSTSPGLQLLGPNPLDRQSLPTLVAGSTAPRPELGLKRLPQVWVEVQRIVATLTKTDVLLNQEFTRDTLQRSVLNQSARIIHIATHGQFSSQSEQTYIVSGIGDRININQLGEILSNRDQTQSQPIELLFLSACETVKGDPQSALGMAGIAVRSGARSTIASLWYADDEASAALVGKFYEHLIDPEVTTKAEALRLAQLDLIHNARFNLPVYWAPYILLGNWL
ncbi:CHAT domain-containing protein [Acaryochloris sp. IP29b_bin.148]|uniref:CHAT domain-containing protein n=1 Tax=Acaryochloris sp. IP29b_bin.148 TaxID=2969218 RepID=UPI00262817AF|nr:CHAT domain-containing protein [Acaryochloris sp. IP29b_bin.148]